VRAASYPEIAARDLDVKRLVSESDYFNARFSIGRMITCRRMRYSILANERLATLDAPAEGVRAIVAHELAHVAYYRSGPRVRLLGLVRLVNPAARARFERAADREAIRRGYGPGLKAYRVWLYGHIPKDKVSAKKRDYLTPDEIDAILANR